jgi:hypothetical protein
MHQVTFIHRTTIELKATDYTSNSCLYIPRPGYYTTIWVATSIDPLEIIIKEGDTSIFKLTIKEVTKT